MSWRGRVARVTLLLAALSHAPHARAQPAPTEAREGRRQVVLESTASLPPSFDDTLRELLGRLSLLVVRPHEAEAPRTLARVRVDPATGGVTVLVYRGARGTLFVQRSVPAGDSSAVLAETVAHVVLGAVEPLAQAEPPAAPAPTDVPASTPAPPLATAPDRSHFLLGGRAALRHLGPDLNGLGASALVGLRMPWPLRPAVTIEGSALVPRDVRRGSIEADVGLQSLRALLHLEVLRAGRFALAPALGAGLDRISLAPESGPTGARLAAASARLQPVITAALDARFTLLPGLEAVATGGLDVDTAPRRWIIEQGARQSIFFEPSAARAFATLGLDFIPGKLHPEAP